ncbi:hypothetical protein ACQEU8_03950 [Streptomyces sp. CA-250714]|uniref:hypothetical protein n=1 Tax=Streptomyces sp. CA-250714 TaxID=3240060 RepID=UPI003D89F902
MSSTGTETSRHSSELSANGSHDSEHSSLRTVSLASPGGAASASGAQTFTAAHESAMTRHATAARLDGAPADTPDESPVLGFIDLERGPGEFLAARRDADQLAVFRWLRDSRQWVADNQSSVARFIRDAFPLALQVGGKGMQAAGLETAGKYVGFAGMVLVATESVRQGYKHYRLGEMSNIRLDAASFFGAAFNAAGTMPQMAKETEALLTMIGTAAQIGSIRSRRTPMSYPPVNTAPAGDYSPVPSSPNGSAGEEMAASVDLTLQRSYTSGAHSRPPGRPDELQRQPTLRRK